MSTSNVQISANPLRPGFGRSGKSLQVRCNIFPVTLRDAKAYQYDVAIVPAVPPAIARKLWKDVERQLSERLGASNARVVYDGSKIAYSSADILADKSIRFTVEFDKSSLQVAGTIFTLTPSKAPQKTPEKAKSDRETFSITLKKVATILFHELLLFSQGKGPETEASLHALNCLSTVLHHFAFQDVHAFGTKFFTPQDKVPLSGGLEVWRGYHQVCIQHYLQVQSIRALLAGHLGVNIDVAASVFRQGNVSLPDLAMQIMGARDMGDLSRRGRLRERLQSELKGVSVVTTHRGDLRQRFKIGSLSTVPASEYTFEMQGKTVSIVQYFAQQYQYRVKYPWLPVVLKANGRTGFPMELLVVAPSQRFMKRLDGQQVADMIKATVQKPSERANKISYAVDSILKHNQNPYMQSFGFEVGTKMMSVNARVLPAPNLIFAGNKSLSGKEGVWNLRDQKLCSAPPLNSLAFCFFVRVGKQDAEGIRNTLLQKWMRTGVNLQVSSAKVPLLTADPFAPGSVRRTLQEAFKFASQNFGTRCQLLVCILDKEPKALYQEIKRITLTEAGVLSQCLQFNHLRREIKDQYAANVAMKVNIKLGGATNTVSNLPLMDRPTMLVGADVTHPSPGSLTPSIAAIVTSMDKNATRYNTFLRAQSPRTEIIEDMEAVVGEGLDRLRSMINMYPERLIFFRDGVASGQFAEVRAKEVTAIKRALYNRGLQDKCKVLVVVVQKRHHIRLFPMDRSQSDRSGNCLPGTVIDTGIVHPFEYNFILQSHSGIQGTSRPTIYHVIHDDINVNPDQLQQLCFNLCFLSERATRSIAMDAPSYRAHLAAFYGRMFIEGDISETGSVRSGGREGPIMMKNVTEAMTRTMYYM